MVKNKFKALSLILLVLFSFSSVFAVPSENLDTSSKIKLFFKNLNPMTIYGQDLGCSVYPDDVIYYNSPSAFVMNFNLKDRFGLANIYTINSNGGYKFIEEVYISELYNGKYFGSFDYAVELYNCPLMENRKPFQTPDGFKNGDFICKDNNLARINFKDRYSYEYQRQAFCENGCSSGMCNSPTTRDLPEYYEHIGQNSQNPTEQVKTWDRDEYNKELTQVIQQLENEIVDIQKLQDTISDLEKQKELESQKLAIKQAKEKLESQKPMDSTTLVGVIALFIVLILVLLIRRFK